MDLGVNNSANIVKTWDLATCCRLDPPEPFSVYSTAVFNDSVFLGSENGWIAMVNLGNGKRHTFQVPNARISSLATNDRHLAVGTVKSFVSRIVIYDIATQKILRDQEVMADRLDAITFLGSSKVVYGAHHHGGIGAVCLDSGISVPSFYEGGRGWAEISQLKYRNWELVAVYHHAGCVNMWDMRHPRNVSKLEHGHSCHYDSKSGQFQISQLHLTDTTMTTVGHFGRGLHNRPIKIVKHQKTDRAIQFERYLLEPKPYCYSATSPTPMQISHVRGLTDWNNKGVTAIEERICPDVNTGASLEERNILKLEDGATYPTDHQVRGLFEMGGVLFTVSEQGRVTGLREGDKKEWDDKKEGDYAANTSAAAGAGNAASAPMDLSA